MSTTVYVLRLQRGKYYVGKTDNVDQRIDQHMSGRGAVWTQKYKPISVEKVLKNASHFDEDKVTKEYMAKHGIDNVRGGTYVQIELSDFHRESLKEALWGAKDLCTQCGRAGHFVKDCYAKTDASGNKIEYEEEPAWCCDYCDREFTTKFACGVHEKSCREKKQTSKQGKCYRCGRAGHYSPDCYAQTHANGHYLEEDDDDDDDEDDY
jgi:predicted GIY-YIG superfamily endonuclease